MEDVQFGVSHSGEHLFDRGLGEKMPTSIDHDASVGDGRVLGEIACLAREEVDVCVEGPGLGFGLDVVDALLVQPD